MTICRSISFFFELVFAVSLLFIYLFIYLHFHLLVSRAICIKTTGEHSRKGVTPVKLVSKILKPISFCIFLSALVSGVKNHLFEREIVFNNPTLLIIIWNKYP